VDLRVRTPFLLGCTNAISLGQGLRKHEYSSNTNPTAAQGQREKEQREWTVNTRKERLLLCQHERPENDKMETSVLSTLSVYLHTYTGTITHLHIGPDYDFISTSLWTAISTMPFPLLSPSKLWSMKHKMNIFICDAVCLQDSPGT